MRLEVLTTVADFSALEQDWYALTDEPLRSFDWHYAWWNAFGEFLDLRLYALWDANCLVGIAPFFVDQWLGQQRLRFIGSGNVCTDYAQLICKSEIRNEFVRQIVSDIVTNTSIGVVELEGIRQDTAEEFASKNMST